MFIMRPYFLLLALTTLLIFLKRARYNYKQKEVVLRAIISIKIIKVVFYVKTIKIFTIKRTDQTDF